MKQTYPSFANHHSTFDYIPQITHMMEIIYRHQQQGHLNVPTTWWWLKCRGAWNGQWRSQVGESDRAQTWSPPPKQTAWRNQRHGSICWTFSSFTTYRKFFLQSDVIFTFCFRVTYNLSDGGIWFLSRYSGMSRNGTCRRLHRALAQERILYIFFVLRLFC